MILKRKNGYLDGDSLHRERHDQGALSRCFVRRGPPGGHIKISDEPLFEWQKQRASTIWVQDQNRRGRVLYSYEPDYGTTRRYRGRLKGPVAFLANLLRLWDIDDASAAILLGLEDVTLVRNILSGASELPTRDTKDRIRHLFAIRAALDQLFRDGTIESDWLREPRAELGGSSPFDLMLEGSMENLLLVRQFVERVSGR